MSSGKEKFSAVLQYCLLLHSAYCLLLLIELQYLNYRSLTVNNIYNGNIT